MAPVEPAGAPRGAFDGGSTNPVTSAGFTTGVEESPPVSCFVASPEVAMTERGGEEPFTPPSHGLRRLWQAGLQSAVRQRIAAEVPLLADAPGRHEPAHEAESHGRRFAIPGAIAHSAATAPPFPERTPSNEEDMAQTLAAILRREAERHGIDLDEATA
jgi:hypothetical protein